MSDSFIGIKKDFSAELHVLLVEAKVVAEDRSLAEAIALLLNFEKKCRLNNDYASLKEVCVFIVQLCKTKGKHARMSSYVRRQLIVDRLLCCRIADWGKLNSSLVVISKRRAQNKMIVSAIGKQCAR